MRVLVVDAANVVGSVPDGWWRDRTGAARRLRDRLAAASLPHDRVVLVLEGKARAGVPEGSVDAVETVHAPASGDDELVAQCRAAASDEVTLVTADRGLIARTAPLGVRGTLGPAGPAAVTPCATCRPDVGARARIAPRHVAHAPGPRPASSRDPCSPAPPAAPAR